MSTTVEIMRERLNDLAPSFVDIVDESAAHAGHAGAASGGGHFRLTIVSEQFAGQGTVIRHKTVYRVLGDLMDQRIHALSIRALTPAEHQPN